MNMIGKKPIVIIFEGVDKSGKTTLLNMFNKATNFGYVVLDRFTTSSKVYNTLFNRDRREYYNEVEQSFLKAFNVLIVYCYCSPGECFSRLAMAKETLPEELHDIPIVKNEFKIELLKTLDDVDENPEMNLKVLEIDTEMFSKEYCVERIQEKVKEMECEDS